MMSFLCHFYGGMPKHWLRTPIRTFFAMYKEGIKMEARHYSEMADISLIANNMKIEYYESVRNRYRRIIDPEDVKLPERPPEMVIEAGSSDAFSLLRGIGNNMRRNLGYGR